MTENVYDEDDEPRGFQEGDRISVAYDSARSRVRQSMKGDVLRSFTHPTKRKNMAWFFCAGKLVVVEYGDDVNDIALAQMSGNVTEEQAHELAHGHHLARAANRWTRLNSTDDLTVKHAGDV